jgi:hypothetical protein
VALYFTPHTSSWRGDNFTFTFALMNEGEKTSLNKSIVNQISGVKITVSISCHIHVRIVRAAAMSMKPAYFFQWRQCCFHLTSSHDCHVGTADHRMLKM